ncbi:MAG: thiamine pyrophosphate-binding protein [Marinobacter sp.]|nr:thiamine pyrophosphate-binding protein [Marinobacter sp.]
MFANGDLILRYLERLGVEYVFGVPGGSIEPFFDALARSERRGGPRLILARHEAGAAFMAEGYARETGKLGVCCATAGPGATNLITGVASAFADNIPMLVITAQTAIEKFGQGSFQETSCTGINTLEMFAPCTRYNTLVSHSAQLEHKLLQAISHTFSNQSGPVHLSVPLDVMRATVPKPLAQGNLRAFINHEVVPSQHALQLLLKDLAVCKKATFVIGESAAGAIPEIMSLVEAKGWRFVATPRGKGLVDNFHPLYCGVFGFAGHESARDALKSENADRVVVIGTALDEIATAGWDYGTILSDRLIHLSPNPEHLLRSTMARLVILGSLEHSLKPFSELINPVELNDATSRAQSLNGLPVGVQFADRDKCLERNETGPVKPQALMTYMSQHCPANTRALMDSGNSFLWGIHYWSVKRPADIHHRKSLFHTGITFASMGWAIGACVGIAAATDGAPVVCFTGDGSYLMAGQEITTAQQYNLNVLMVVLNDSSLGMVRHGQQLSGAEAIGTELPRIDFAMMAKAAGVESYRIDSMADLAALDLTAIFARPGPCLLDVRIDGDQVPPMGARIKVLTGAV